MTVAHTAWRVLGASVAGSSHRATGRGCDDAHGWRLLDDGTLLLAAADGAGSAAHGAVGAEAAVQATLDSLTLALLWDGPPDDDAGWDHLMHDVVEEARAALVDLVSEVSIEHPGLPPSLQPSPCQEEGANHAVSTTIPRAEAPPWVGEGPVSEASGERSARTPNARRLQDFATTLLVAVVTDGRIAAAHIGDGAIVLDSEAGLCTLTLPEHGEYLNETVFITSDDYRARARIVVLPRHGARAIALLTDGLEGLALNLAEGVPHSPFFAPLFGFASQPDANEEELASFLDSARVCARTDDDKTLLMAVFA